MSQVVSLVLTGGWSTPVFPVSTGWTKAPLAFRVPLGQFCFLEITAAINERENLLCTPSSNT